MSKLAPGLPNGRQQVNSPWLEDEEMRRIKLMALRGQRQRNGSFSSTSTVGEFDLPRCGYERRGSAPEWEHINKVLLARRFSQTPAQPDWGNSSIDIDLLQHFDMAKHLLERDGMSSRRQSLPTGDLRWGESTMTMEIATSIGGTLNGPHRKFKVILLGDCGVGKSSFLQTLLNGKYTESMPHTNLVTANAVRTFLYNGHEVELNFFDTAGQERYRSMTASYYRHAQGCLMFFNVNHKQTFDHIELWLDDLMKYGKRDNMAVLLVGLTHKHVPRNRQDNGEGSCDNLALGRTRSWSDLDSSAPSCNKRAIPRAQAEHLASNRYIPYIEADIQSDPGAVLRTIDKLLDLLMCRVVQVEERSQSISIKPKKNSKPPSDCCNSSC